MLKIHDIKPIVIIPDHSIYLYYGLIVSAIIICSILLFWIYRVVTAKKVSNDKEYFKILKDIDFGDVKNSAYTMTKYGRLLARDERQKLLLDELYSSLEEYKYKKIVSSTLSNDVKLKYDNFMESLDVK